MSRSKRKFNLVLGRTNGPGFRIKPFLEKGLNAFVYDPEYQLEADLYRVAAAVFQMENAIKKGKEVESIRIPITRKTSDSIKAKNIESALKEIIRYITDKDVDFKLVPESIKLKEKKFEVKGKFSTICLFSGGADSLVGKEYSKRKYGDIACIYVRHSTYRKLTPVLDYLERDMLTPEGIRLDRIAAPPHPEGYSQTRGLVYLLCAGVYASLYNSKRIVMSECGPTIYQPKFGNLDEVTYTSHPYVIQAAGKILQGFLGRKIAIETPFENNTKAEMLKMYPNIEQYLPKTHSCITCRWNTKENSVGCGFCYGCIVRRLSFTAAGIKDAPCNGDVLTEDNTKVIQLGRGTATIEKKSERLLALMRFSYDVLTDYENMPEFTKERIELFGKRDLFTRFALDNLAALYRLYEKEKIGKNKVIEKMYWDIRNTIPASTLEERLNKLNTRT